MVKWIENVGEVRKLSEKFHFRAMSVGSKRFKFFTQPIFVLKKKIDGNLCNYRLKSQFVSLS